MKPLLPIAIAGVVVTGFIGYNMIYAPQQRKVTKIRDDTAKEQAKQQTEAEVETLLQQIGRYRERLPSEPDPSWLAKEVVELTRKANIELNAISQEPPKTLQKITRLAVTIEFFGTYHQLGTFLDEVERNHHFIRVDTVDVSSSGADARGRPKIRLVLSTIYLAPPAAAPAAAVGLH